MKNKILFLLLVLVPGLANAEMPYRTQQVIEPIGEYKYTSNPFAQEHRFYVGASYNLSMWSDYNDGNLVINGKNTSGIDASVGVRVSDIFRVEANYAHIDAKWNMLEFSSNQLFVNAIFDARIDSMYRMFNTQTLVPYVGFGAGLSWNDADGDILGRESSPLVAALAGVSVELGEYFALDFGYKYVYMFDPKIQTVSDFNPVAHQFRAGARINF